MTIYAEKYLQEKKKELKKENKGIAIYNEKKNEKIDTQQKEITPSLSIK